MHRTTVLKIFLDLEYLLNKDKASENGEIENKVFQNISSRTEGYSTHEKI